MPSLDPGACPELEIPTPVGCMLKKTNRCNHTNGGNVAYVDGSVRFQTIGKFPYIAENLDIPGQVLGIWIGAEMEEMYPFSES